MRYIALMALAGLLAACQPGASVTCPQIKQHNAAFWRAARTELETAIKTSPHLVQLLKDYELTTDAVKACLRHRK